MPATVSFTILAPIWMRPWLWALGGLAVAAVVYALHRNRVAQLLEVANIRARIATDLHDDIGSNLTRIAVLSEVVRHQHGEGEAQADTPLASIARISRESVSSMSDIVWAISPHRDSMLDLVRRMREHGEEVFALRGIDLTFSAPDADTHLQPAGDVRRNLLLVFKEAVNNAARHSRCSRVDIVLRAESSSLVLRVVDNGVGFDPSVESDGQGLLSMGRRARESGGELTIDSKPNAGTTLMFRVPIARSR